MAGFDGLSEVGDLVSIGFFGSLGIGVESAKTFSVLVDLGVGSGEKSSIFSQGLFGLAQLVLGVVQVGGEGGDSVSQKALRLSALFLSGGVVGVSSLLKSDSLRADGVHEVGDSAIVSFSVHLHIHLHHLHHVSGEGSRRQLRKRTEVDLSGSNLASSDQCNNE